MLPVDFVELLLLHVMILECESALSLRGSIATSFPGFSSTRPTSLRRAGRREPWERGWVD